MNNVKRNKILVFAFALLLILSIGFITIFSSFNNSVLAETTLENGIVFEEGAKIRAKADDDKIGVQFVAKIDATFASAFFTKNSETGIANGFRTNCSMGMIIVPKRVFELATNAENSDYLNYIETAFKNAKSYKCNFSFDDKNIFANYDNPDAEQKERVLNEDYPYMVKGSIFNIGDKNLQYDYQAVIYYSTDNGATYKYSSLSDSINFAEKADSVLKETQTFFDVADKNNAVINTLVSYITKSEIVKLTGNTDGLTTTDGVATLTAEKTFDVGSSFDISTLFKNDIDIADCSCENFEGCSTDGTTITAPSKYGKTIVTTSKSYNDVEYIRYQYTVYAVPTIETDLYTGYFGSDFNSATNIIIDGREFDFTDEVVDENTIHKVKFDNSGTNDARDLASDKQKVVTVKIGDETYKAKVTLWSMLVTNSNFLKMYDYQYNAAGVKSDLLYGYYKLTEDVDFSTYTQAVELGGYDCTEVGGTTKEKTSSQTLYHGFAGVFDGANHTISYSMATGVAPVSLFFVITGGTVKNLTIVKTTGKYVSPLVASYANGATFENITAKSIANTGSFGERSALLLQSLWGGNTVTFKNIKLELGAETSWSYFNTPILANTADNASYTVYMRFTGKVVIDGLDVFFSSSSYSPFHYSNTTGGFADYYCKLVNGTAYTNYHTEKDGDTTVYYADAVPAIEVVEGLNTVKIHKSKNATLTAENDATGFPYTPSVIYKTMAVEKDTTFTYASALTSGKTLNRAYSVDIAEDTEYSVASSTVTGDFKTITRLVDSGNAALTSFICTTAGTYNFIVCSTDYEVVFVTVTVIVPKVETITSEFAYDLKDGIDIPTMFDSSFSDTIYTASLGSALFVVENNKIVFTEKDGSLLNATKNLPKEEAQTLTLMSSTTKYVFTNFKLYSILVSNASEYHEVASYQAVNKISSSYYSYWAVIGFDADFEMDKLVAGDILGPSSAGVYSYFNGVIDGRGHTITGFDNTEFNYFGFSSTAYGAKLKNISLYSSAYATNGLFGRYSGNITFDNVLLYLDISILNENGILFREFRGSGNITFKDTTVINPTNSDMANGYALSWFGYPYTNSSSPFTGRFIVDNLTLVSYNKPAKLCSWIFGSTGKTLPAEYGGAVVKPDDVEVGITYYDSQSDYENKINAKTAEYDIVEQSLTAKVGSKFNVSKLIGDDETYAYRCATVGTGTNSYYCGNGTTLKYSTAGTYKFAVVTTNHKTYIYTVVVS